MTQNFLVSVLTNVFYDWPDFKFVEMCFVCSINVCILDYN